MKIIRLTNEQYSTLEHLLDYEFDQELNYQEQEDKNTDLLEEYYSLYEAIYKGQAKSFIDAIVIQDIMDNKRKQIDYLKEESNNV